MISSEEFSAAMRGTWRLLNRDAGGYADFNLSYEGLKNSFTSVLIVAPVYLFIVATSNSLTSPPIPVAYGRELIALLFEWAVFVALAVLAGRMLGRTTQLVPFLIAYNWSSVFIVFAMVPPALLSRYGLITSGGLLTAGVVVTLIALYFRWYIARTGLRTTGSIAFALVVADVAISLMAEVLIR